MAHAAIIQIQKRIESAKQDSDFTYFYALLLEGEALLKTTVLGLIGSLVNDPDRQRYRLEHKILKADGLGPWSMALEDSLIGPASQFLLTDLSTEKNELTKLCAKGTWQYEAVHSLKHCLDSLGIDAEEVPSQTDMKRWFSLFAVLRNKTRGHGATMPGKVAQAALDLKKSISQFHNNHALFKRQWAYLYRNLSGKYRVTPITENADQFAELKKESDRSYPNGVYIFAGTPRLIPFLESDADLTDFFYPNGGFGKKTFECISYATDNKKEGDGTAHLMPPGTLPSSETQGLGELDELGKCFSNAPLLSNEYISRPVLEAQIKQFTEDDRHPIVTLLGRGGIGKTSLALKVLNLLSGGTRFTALLWFSARDVDLQFCGPKPVKPHVLSPEEVSRLYVTLVAPASLKDPGFRSREYFEKQLTRNELGPCLFVFDNFETTQNPEELFTWIDTHVRLPNKILITTRLRDFKGDYPIEVGGMTDDEARELIDTTAGYLKIRDLLPNDYITELIQQAEGHPYVIKILLGEVAKEKRAGHIERLVAGRDEILTALFERTYASLSPCAQRTFMTLAAWNSAVPRVALEAVLQKSVGEILEVERAVDLLLQFSLAERRKSVEGMDFIALPLVALTFGRKKLNISPFQSAIKADADLLQMLGTVNRSEVHFSLAKRIDYFLGSITRRMGKGDTYEKYTPIVEMIGRHFPPAWLSLARLHMEEGTRAGYEKAQIELRRYLEQDYTSPVAAEAWLNLAHCCFKTGDMLGDIHAFVQRSKIASVPFADLTNTARLLNDLIRRQMLNVGADEKRALGQELLDVMQLRIDEASADDLAQAAWLALRLRNYERASAYVRLGLSKDNDNLYLLKLSGEPNIKV
ncbi:MAG: NB-ARC domain-containing protein [Lacunisphaera sp.]|nr:NB-ARC domain-containing protein [Lacunisphaera sp.]